MTRTCPRARKKKLFPGIGANAPGVAAGSREHAQLQVRALLQVTRRHRRAPHLCERRGETVAAHHDSEAATEAVRKGVAQLTAANEADALVFRNALEERAPAVVNDTMRLPDLGETDAGRGMRVDDAADVGPRRIGASVNPEFTVGRPVACQDVAVGVEHQQMVFIGQAG